MAFSRGIVVGVFHWEKEMGKTLLGVEFEEKPPSPSVVKIPEKVCQLIAEKFHKLSSRPFGSEWSFDLRKKLLPKVKP